MHSKSHERTQSLAGLDVELVAGDLFQGLPGASWDLVVSNPPYVSPAEIELLEPEVRDWEPRAALVAEGATEAVAAVRVRRSCGAAVRSCSRCLRGTRARWPIFVRELGFARIRVTRDLAGRERVVEGVRP